MSIPRLLAVWLLLAVLMSGNGIFREMVLVPMLGPSTAGVISVILGLAIILATTAAFFRELTSASTTELALASLLLVALTVAFEFAIGRYVDHKSWAELVGNYAIWRGHLWPLVLLVIATTPFVWGRWVPSRGTS